MVAIGYGGALNWSALALTALGLAMVAALARLGVRSVPAYSMFGGLIWLALDASGVHPTLAGVALGLMTPTRRWVSDSRLHAILNRLRADPPGAGWSGAADGRRDLLRAGIATREALSPVERLESALHPWVAFAVMPLFALANAGVPLSAANFDHSVAIAVFSGFVLGKPLGVLLFSVLAVRLRLAVRPPSLSWSLLAAGGILTGIGFTMALLIAGLAFGPGLLNSAKLGILASSGFAGTSGLIALAWLTSRKTRGNGTAPPRLRVPDVG